MIAEVITIGDELLRGEIVDSNKARIADRLLLLDVECRFQVSVLDDPTDMEDAFRRARQIDGTEQIIAPHDRQDDEDADPGTTGERCQRRRDLIKASFPNDACILPRQSPLNFRYMDE